MNKQILFIGLSIFAAFAVWLTITIRKHTKVTTIELNSSDKAGSYERTLALIKPDAVRAGDTGMIINLIELNTFAIAALKKVQLNRDQAQKFYAIHREKPFFNDLITFMTSGPIIAMALEKKNAIKDWRDFMGATNPEEAAPGTLRKMFGTSHTFNATHGSDSSETVATELAFFFPEFSPTQSIMSR